MITEHLKGRQGIGDTITLGVDSSTTNCGVAVFVNGKLKQTANFEFKGKYSIEKLKAISFTFNNLFADYSPDIVLIEEPAPVRNSRAITGLNQVAGAIAALGFYHGAHVDFVHNQTVKKTYKIKTKQDSINIVRRSFRVRKDMTEHEADAVLVVSAYIKLYGG